MLSGSFAGSGRFGLLGSLRAVSQAAAYEVCLSWILMLLVALTGTVRLSVFTGETGQSIVMFAAVCPLLAGC